eukprot:10310945-Alexandrium_andersonii.AAC.1
MLPLLCGQAAAALPAEVESGVANRPAPSVQKLSMQLYAVSCGVLRFPAFLRGPAVSYGFLRCGGCRPPDPPTPRRGD